MSRLTENKIILITRHTRLDELISRFNTETQARFYLEHLGADFSDYQQEDRCYKAAIERSSQLLATLGRLQIVQRNYLANFIFGKDDTVVVLGQDGLVANVLKYLDQQPVIGVNPDPGRWEGVLLPFTVDDLTEAVPATFNQSCTIRKVTMAKAELNTGQTLYGVNDLFIGPRSHTSAHYSMTFKGETEQHSSSGIIVSTGLGSSGWLRSIVAGSTGIAAALSGQTVMQEPQLPIEWHSRFLYFSVREPWPSTHSSCHMTFGTITRDQPLQLVSQMPEHGVIFSDGIEKDFIAFNAGTHATIRLAEKRGHLVTKN